MSYTEENRNVVKVNSPMSTDGPLSATSKISEFDALAEFEKKDLVSIVAILV